MRLVIISILLFISSCSDKPSVFNKRVEGSKIDKDGNCFINTAEISEADGINMDMYYPCSWSEVLYIPNSNSGLIKKIGDTLKDKNINTLLLLFISNLKDTLTTVLFDRLMSEVFLTGKTLLDEGTFSADTVEINGLKGGKTRTRIVLGSGQVMYGLNIYFYSKTKIIQIRYTIGAPTEEEAISYFNKQEPLLMELARKTKFYDIDDKEFY